MHNSLFFFTSMTFGSSKAAHAWDGALVISSSLLLKRAPRADRENQNEKKKNQKKKRKTRKEKTCLYSFPGDFSPRICRAEYIFNSCRGGEAALREIASIRCPKSNHYSRHSGATRICHRAWYARCRRKIVIFLYRVARRFRRTCVRARTTRQINLPIKKRIGRAATRPANARHEI